MGRPGATTGTHKKPKLGPSDAAYPRFLPRHQTTYGPTYPHSEGGRPHPALGGSKNLQHARLPPRPGRPPHGGLAPKRPPPRTNSPERRAESQKRQRHNDSQADAPILLPPTIQARFEPPAGIRKVTFQKPADQWNAFGTQKRAIRLPGAPLDDTRRRQTERRPGATTGGTWGKNSAWGDPTLQTTTTTNATPAVASTMGKWGRTSAWGDPTLLQGTITTPARKTPDQTLDRTDDPRRPDVPTTTTPNACHARSRSRLTTARRNHHAADPTHAHTTHARPASAR